MVWGVDCFVGGGDVYVCMWGGEMVKRRGGREDQAGRYQLPVKFVVGSGRVDDGCRFVNVS